MKIGSSGGEKSMYISIVEGGSTRRAGLSLEGKGSEEPGVLFATRLRLG